MKLSLHTIKHLKPSDTTQGPKLAKLQLLFHPDNLTHRYTDNDQKQFSVSRTKTSFRSHLKQKLPRRKISNIHKTTPKYTEKCPNSSIHWCVSQTIYCKVLDGRIFTNDQSSIRKQRRNGVEDEWNLACIRLNTWNRLIQLTDRKLAKGQPLFYPDNLTAVYTNKDRKPFSGSQDLRDFGWRTVFGFWRLNRKLTVFNEKLKFSIRFWFPHTWNLKHSFQIA